MRILLPPSEAKRPGGSGPPLARTGFAPTELGRHRARLCRATARTAAGRPATARSAFVLPAAVAADAILANRGVLESCTLPAIDRYSGTVYDALDIRTLSADQRACADRSVLIFSGLFGVLGADEPIPDYRVPAATTLPRIGAVGRSWRPILIGHLAARVADAVVVDLRSTDYASMWRADGRLVVTVRMLSRRPDGTLAVTSFFSKRAKGRLARLLLEHQAAGAALTGAQDVADLWCGAGLGSAARLAPRSPTHVDVDLVTDD